MENTEHLIKGLLFFSTSLKPVVPHGSVHWFVWKTSGIKCSMALLRKENIICILNDVHYINCYCLYKNMQ